MILIQFCDLQLPKFIFTSCVAVMVVVKIIMRDGRWECCSGSELGLIWRKEMPSREFKRFRNIWASKSLHSAARMSFLIQSNLINWISYLSQSEVHKNEKTKLNSQPQRNAMHGRRITNDIFDDDFL